MDEFTLIYDNIVMALEIEQIDKVNVSKETHTKKNIEQEKREKCYSNTKHKWMTQRKKKQATRERATDCECMENLLRKFKSGEI